MWYFTTILEHEPGKDFIDIDSRVECYPVDERDEECHGGGHVLQCPGEPETRDIALTDPSLLLLVKEGQTAAVGGASAGEEVEHHDQSIENVVSCEESDALQCPSLWWEEREQGTTWLVI